MQMLRRLPESLQHAVLQATPASLFALLSALPSDLHATAISAALIPGPLHMRKALETACDPPAATPDPPATGQVLVLSDFKDTRLAAPAAALAALSSQLDACCHVTALSLGGLVLAAPAVAALAALLPRLPALAQLDIKQTVMRGDVAAPLVRVLPACTALTTLDLSHTFLSDAVLDTLLAWPQPPDAAPSPLRRLAMLGLSLSRSQFDMLVSLAKRLPALAELLCWVGAWGAARDTAPAPLRDCTTLEVLVLNAAERTSLRAIVPEALALPRLRILDVYLAHRLVSDAPSWPAASLPPTLRHLQLPFLAIGGSAPPPAGLRHAELILPTTADAGTLHTWLAGLPCLRSLTLELLLDRVASNQVLPGLAAAARLTALELMQALPAAALPEALAPLTGLRRLSVVAAGSFHGVIPLLRKFTALEVLELGSQFRRMVPRVTADDGHLCKREVVTLLSSIPHVHALTVQCGLGPFGGAPPPLPALTRLVLMDRSNMAIAPAADVAALLRAAPALEHLQLGGLRVPRRGADGFWSAVAGLKQLTMLGVSIARAHETVDAAWFACLSRHLSQRSQLLALALTHGAVDAATLAAGNATVAAALLRCTRLRSLSWPLAADEPSDAAFARSMLRGLPNLVELAVTAISHGKVLPLVPAELRETLEEAGEPEGLWQLRAERKPFEAGTQCEGVDALLQWG